MPTSIFVNLPVRDLDASKAFFTAIGFSINPRFTDETAACVVVSEDIFVMLLTHAKFATFIKKPIVDAMQGTEAIIALSRDSKAEVDAIADKALAAGATSYRDPDDHGFMYARSIQDLDGHLWEFLWMDPATIA